MGAAWGDGPGRSPRPRWSRWRAVGRRGPRRAVRPRRRGGAGVCGRQYAEFRSHPGLVVGGEAVPVRSPYHGLATAASLGFYAQPGNHRGLFLDLEVGWPVTARCGLCGEVLGGLGSLHTFLAAPVYAVEDGQTRRTACAPSA